MQYVCQKVVYNRNGQDFIAEVHNIAGDFEKYIKKIMCCIQQRLIIVDQNLTLNSNQLNQKKIAKIVRKDTDMSIQ